MGGKLFITSRSILFYASLFGNKFKELIPGILLDYINLSGRSITMMTGQGEYVVTYAQEVRKETVREIYVLMQSLRETSLKQKEEEDMIKGSLKTSDSGSKLKKSVRSVITMKRASNAITDKDTTIEKLQRSSLQTSDPTQHLSTDDQALTRMTTLSSTDWGNILQGARLFQFQD